MAKTGLAFILGAAVGSVATFFAVKKKFKDDSEAFISEEIELMRQHFEEKLSEYEPKSEKAVNGAKNGLKTAKSEGSDKKFDSPEEERQYYDGLIDKLNYNAISRKKNDDENEETKKPVPVVVTSDEFMDDEFKSKECKAYNIRYFKFFEGDAHHESVVIDDSTDEIVEDGLDIIGRDNLDSFGSEDPNVTYIRNDLEKLYIEVMYDERNYEETEYYED